MLSPDPATDLVATFRLPLVVLASAIAGGVNSIAGGGTLLTFPALVGLGIPPLVANATSTVALWPGALGSMWGYRDELRGSRRWIAAFTAPSLLGGLLGALLLLRTPPDRFAALAPWLVLGATGLFILQLRTPRGWGGAHAAEPPEAARAPHVATVRRPTLVAQFIVAIYGGYFGAGVGILMLATLGFAGLHNIHQMNGVKNWGGLCMNAIAAIAFAVSGIVNWPVAVAMAVGATLGGYGGSRLAQRVSQRAVRTAIVVVGLVSGIWLLTSL